MQRFDKTKAKASRMDFYLLFGFFLLGSAGFIISITSLEGNAQELKMVTLQMEKEEVYLSKSENVELNQWNTFELNNFVLSEETEVIVSPKTPMKVYGNSMIGLYFNTRGKYEITFKDKKDLSIILREQISL